MFSETIPKRNYSDIGLVALVVSVVALFLLIFADAYIRNYMREHLGEAARFDMLAMLVLNFRYFFEQGMIAATIMFVGMKFIETRTVFSVSFEKLDVERVSVKGPDENNIVWIGQRYATPIEARAVSEALAERLKQSAV